MSRPTATSVSMTCSRNTATASTFCTRLRRWVSQWRAQTNSIRTKIEHQEEQFESLRRVFIRLDRKPALGFLGHQVRTNKRVKITVQYAVHVTDLELRAVVLDQTIGLHHGRADRAAKGDIHFGLVQLSSFSLPFFDFQVVEL